MTTVYPGAIDSFTNPGPSSTELAPSHYGQHAQANDAIEAIETELGVNPSGNHLTVKDRMDAYGGVITVGPSLSGAKYEYGASAFNTDVGAAANQAFVDNPGRTVKLVGAIRHPVKTSPNLGSLNRFDGEGRYQTILDVQPGFTPGAGDAVVQTTRNANGYRQQITNMAVDGHRRDGRTGFHAYHLTISAPPVGFGAGGFGPDPSPTLDYLFAYDIPGDMYVVDGTDPANPGGMIGANLMNLRGQHCAGWGLRCLSSDAKLFNHVFNDTEGGGEWLDGGNIQGSMLRVNFSGMPGALAPGYKITGGRCLLVGAAALDNLGLGADISGDNCTLVDFIGDSNGDGLTATTASNINLTGSHARITGQSFMRASGGATSKLAGAGAKYGIRYGSSVTKSEVRLVLGSPTNPAPWAAGSGVIGAPTDLQPGVATGSIVSYVGP